MGNLIKKMVTRVSRSQSGFTLAELLVVVAIIVALAAVIIPTVTRFTGKGDEGAKSAENQNVQAAMDAMMADNSLTAISGAMPSSSVNDWITNPGTGATALNGYLRADATKYFYCYDSTGLITRQDSASAGACP